MNTPFSRKIEAIGSVIEIFYLQEKEGVFVENALKKVMDFNNNFSRFRDNNLLSLVNEAGGEWVKVSDEMYFLLNKSWEYFQLTKGFFNIGLAEELEDLGYDKNYSFKNVKGSGDFGEKLKIEFRNENEVKVNRKIEFGGLGKGYVLDFVKEILESGGVDNYLINAGGDIYAKGNGVDGGGWKIILENPVDNKYGIGEIICSDLFLAASSASKRRWGDSHHLLDEKGNSAQEMLGVFVQGKQGVLADAMATSLFVMGMEKAREVLPGLGVEALLIDKNLGIYKTDGFEVTFYK